MSRFTLLASLVLLCATRTFAAENVYLQLKSNGTDIKGESSVNTLGRADNIECFSYEQEVDLAGSQRRYEPLVITKRLDKSSPLLMKSMLENAKIDATFKFFRPNPTGDGTTEQFYTVTLKGARILSVHQKVPDTRDKANASLPPLEEVAFAFTSITWTYTNGGVTYEDGSVQMTGTASGSGTSGRLRIPIIPK